MNRIAIAAGVALVLVATGGASAKTTDLGSTRVLGPSLDGGTVLAQRGSRGGRGGRGGGRAVFRGGGGRTAFRRGGGGRTFIRRGGGRGRVAIPRFRGRSRIVRRGRRFAPYVTLGFGLPYVYSYGYPYYYNDDDCYELHRVWTRFGWRRAWVYVCD
jgi:hypothetical protein